MKTNRLLSLFVALPSFLFGAAYDIVIPQIDSAGTSTVERTVAPTADSLLAFDASKVPGAVAKSTFITSGGVITLPFSYSADTITITEATPDTGTIDVTKAFGSATMDEATTLKASTVTSVVNTFIVRKLINSTATEITVTLQNSDASAISTVAVPANTFVSATLQAISGTAWVLYSGADPAAGTAATTSFVSLQNPTTGAWFKDEASDVLALNDARIKALTNTTLDASATGNAVTIAARLGSHTTPDTTAGAITWTAPVYEVFANTATEYDLPAAAGYDKKAIIVYNTGANIITIDPDGTEVIVRDGTVQTGGVTMTLTAGAGNYVCMICDGVRWVTLGFKGSLAAGS